MKTIKRVIAMLLCVMMIMSAFACRKDTYNSIVKITLSEVAHSTHHNMYLLSLDILKMRALTLILSQALVLIR